MPEAHLVTYDGSPGNAHSLVDCLEAAGVRVAWTLPSQTRGAGEVIRSVVINMSTRATIGRVWAGVHRFQNDFPGKGHVQVDWHVDEA
jgi:hypothetical protein